MTRKSTLALLGLLALASGVGAQAPTATEDAARFEDLRMHVRVEEDGRSEQTQSMRVLLRNAAAVAQYGQIAQMYVEGYTEVSFEGIEIRKSDGRSVAVNNARIEDLNPFGTSPLPIASDIRIRKVTIPGLEPGDTLSWLMRVREKPMVKDEIYGEAKFYPLLGSPRVQLELDLPKSRTVHIKLREGLGASFEEVPSPPDRVVRRLGVSVPLPKPGLKGAALHALQRSLAEADVTYSSFQSWDAITQWWWALAKDRLVADAAARAEAAKLAEGASTPEEKLTRIAAFVGTRIRYLNIGFGIGRMQPRTVPEILGSRYGDCKDKQTLVAAMAGAVGVDVRPVLIHASREELLDDVPSPSQFNHMIGVARLGPDPSTWVWIDTTNPMARAGTLVKTLRDKRALIVEPDGRATLARTPKNLPFATRAEVEAKARLDANGELAGHVQWLARGDEEVMLRNMYAMLPGDRLAGVVERSFLGGWKDGKVTSVVALDPSDMSRPFTVDFDVKRTETDVSSTEEWGFSAPVPSLGLDEPEPDADEHGTILALGTNETVMRADVELPEGVAVKPPLSISVSRPFGRYEAKYSVEGHTLHVERRLSVTRFELKEEDRGAYESLRRAVDSDEDQEFRVGPLTAKTASAATLMSQGEKAQTAKDYAKAAELYRKAVELDPKVKDGWSDLGRALRDKGDWDGARTAFDKQIEVDAFHETAYAERAYVLIHQGRWEAAESELLKQIEVAPFKAWSYASMGMRRSGQARFDESADYYRRATQLEPADAEHWVDLGWSLTDAKKDADARAALQQARSLTLDAAQQLRVARAYRMLGDDATAGSMAEAALPGIASHLTKKPGPRDDFDASWTGKLLATWQLLGQAALAKGDRARASGYLGSAWRIGLLPEAAWSLGLMREAEGKAAEAAMLFAAAAAEADSQWRLPRGWEARVKAANATVSRIQATDFLTRARLIRAGTASGTFSADIRVVVSRMGMEGFRTVGTDPAVDRAVIAQAPGLMMAALALPWPDDRDVKLVLRGLFSCTPEGGCGFLLDLPDLDRQATSAPGTAPGEAVQSAP